MDRVTDISVRRTDQQMTEKNGKYVEKQMFLYIYESFVVCPAVQYATIWTDQIEPVYHN